jgi:hypothetical protein
MIYAKLWISCNQSYCHVQGLRVTNKNGFWFGWLDWLVLLYNYNQLQSLVTVHNRWLPKARSVSFLDYEHLLFHGGWLNNSCCWPIHSFTNWFTLWSLIHSASCESYITTYGHSVRLGIDWPPFITFRNACRNHRLEGFRYCCLCIRCAGNMISSMVTESVV